MKFNIGFGKVFLFSFLTVSIASFCACKTIEGEKSVNYVSITPVKYETLKQYHGIVKSRFMSKLSFQTEGRISYIPYTKGDYVTKGQVLARLDGVLYKIRKNEEQARLKEMQVRYNKSLNYYKRMDTLHKEGGISDNDWEEAYFNYKANAEEIKVQKEKIAYLNKEISYNIITAPYTGYIYDKYAEVGSYAKIGETVLTIIGTNKTQVEIMVESNLINKLSLNKTVTVKRNGAEFQGKINNISKSSLEDGGYLVRILIDEVVPTFKDGMTVDVLIPVNDCCLAYVPLNSVFEENDEKFVYKIVNIKNNTGTVQKEKVKTGNVSNDEIEIVKGLKKDDFIISDNVEKISPHSKVKF